MKILRTVLAILFLSAIAPVALADIVTAVDVQGNLRTSTDLILEKVATRAGEEYSQEKIREDIRSIYGFGNFSDVAVARDDKGKVTFLVRENPALHNWSVKGDDTFTQDDIGEDLPLKAGEIIKVGQLEKAVDSILSKYHEKGYFLAKVTTDEVLLDDGLNRVDLTFTLKAGDKVRIRKINLAGVTDYTEMEDLRDGFSLSEETFWSWLTDSGAYNPDELERDVEWIKFYYFEKGHAIAEVGRPVVNTTADMRKVRIDIPVSPGPVFTYGKISFSGDHEMAEEILREAIVIKEGDKFSTSSIRLANKKIAEMLGNEGYAFAQVRPLTDLDRENDVMNIDFNVNKGEPVTIGRIEMEGNTTTRDRIIRREVRLAEGELYNGTKIEKSKSKLSRLGLFGNVDFDMRKRPDEAVVDINIKVEETTTGSFTAGGGYSSVDGVIGMLSVNHRNVMGYGYQLGLEGTFGVSKETYSLTFNNPRLFDSNVYAGIDLYKSFNEYTEYSKDSQGFALKTGLSFADDWATRLTYKLDKSKVYDICTEEEVLAGNCSPAASVSVQEQEGTIITASLTPSLIYDSRNKPFDASDGIYFKSFLELAGGPLGFDSNFYKIETQLKKYWGFFENNTFTIEGNAGYLDAFDDDEVPIYELFALGGINTLRGFSWRSIGPEDKGEYDDEGNVIREPSGEVVGGNKYALLNVEYLIPIVEEANLKFVMFFDAGNVWDTDENYFSSKLRMGAGYGLRWFSPLGPLRLEYGYNLDPEEGEDRSRWEFSIGGFF